MDRYRVRHMRHFVWLDLTVEHVVVTRYRGPILECEFHVISAPRSSTTECLSRDVAYESYKAYRKGPTATEAANFSETTRIGMLATKRAVFQSIASMALPAFTIHTIVKSVSLCRVVPLRTFADEKC